MARVLDKGVKLNLVDATKGAVQFVELLNSQFTTVSKDLTRSVEIRLRTGRLVTHLLNLKGVKRYSIETVKASRFCHGRITSQVWISMKPFN